MSVFLHEVLIPLVIGLISSAVVVLVGVRSIKEQIRERDRVAELGLLVDFWKPPGGSYVFNLIFAADWCGRENQIDPRFGYAQAYGVAEITKCLEKVFYGRAIIRSIVVRKNDVLASNLFDENVILFGGEASISEFGVISRKFQVPYYQYNLDLNSRCFETHCSHAPSEIIFSVVRDGRLISDVGTVTRIINPANGSLIIMLNGNYGAGLLASVLAISRNTPLLGGISRASSAQQLLVKVSNIVGNMINRDHEVGALRPWIEFSPPGEGEPLSNASPSSVESPRSQ